MEAMSAGLLCVHSNLGALYETAANWTNMYQYQEDLNIHANVFYQVLSGTVENYWDPGVQGKIHSQKAYADVFYGWQGRVPQWNALLTALKDMPRELPKDSGQYFQYRT